MSALLFGLSLLPAVIGPFWGVFVGRSYRRWHMPKDVGFALAVAPPFLISVSLGVASALTR